MSDKLANKIADFLYRYVEQDDREGAKAEIAAIAADAAQDGMNIALDAYRETQHKLLPKFAAQILKIIGDSKEAAALEQVLNA